MDEKYQVINQMDKIISMDVDDTTLGEYYEHWRELTCCIHDCVFH